MVKQWMCNLGTQRPNEDFLAYPTIHERSRSIPVLHKQEVLEVIDICNYGWTILLFRVPVARLIIRFYLGFGQLLA